MPQAECRRMVLYSSIQAATSRASRFPAVDGPRRDPGHATRSPHGCPGPSTPPTNARATRARSARPPARPPSQSPGSLAQSSAHPPSSAARPADHRAGRPCAWECTPDSAARVKPEPAAGAVRPWLSVESRRCVPTVLAAGRRPLTCIAAVTQVVPRWPHLRFAGVLHYAPLP